MEAVKNLESEQQFLSMFLKDNELYKKYLKAKIQCKEMNYHFDTKSFKDFKVNAYASTFRDFLNNVQESFNTQTVELPINILLFVIEEYTTFCLFIKQYYFKIHTCLVHNLKHLKNDVKSCENITKGKEDHDRFLRDLLTEIHQKVYNMM